jgi:hypothetical protein
MPITQRCNYAGSLGSPIRTRSLASMVVSALRELLRR